jgi:hypothetical protein
MFGTIRKHQTWLWAVIITITVISFVIFFSPYTKLQNAGSSSANIGSINGQRISLEQWRSARREVDLRYFFMSGGNWPGDDAKKMGFDPDRETYQWLLLIQKEDQLGIHISSDLIAHGARNMLMQFQKAGLNSPKMFEDKLLAPHGLTLDDFERYTRHYLGIQELITTVGLGGKLITPQEARALYVRDHEELATEAVFFSGSNYLGSVTVAPEAVAQFYSNRLATYRIPEQIQVSYIRFGISNVMPEVEAELAKTNLAEIIEDNYQRLGTNYFKDAKTPEEAKAKIREEIIRGQALAKIRKPALDFANPLSDLDAALQIGAFEKAAKEQNLSIEVTAPFDREDGPKQLDVGPDFARAAFTRTDQDPIAGPIMGKDGWYVIAKNKRIESRIPTLDEIRDRVTADYKYSQALNLARTAGVQFANTATNGLAQGKTFAAICTEAKLTPVVLPPFSISSRAVPEAEDHLALRDLKQVAFSTTVGKSSEFQGTSEGGIVLYVKSRLPLEETKINAELPSFMTSVRQTRQTEAFNDWFRREAERGLRDTPLLRQQQQQGAPQRSARS